MHLLISILGALFLTISFAYAQDSYDIDGKYCENVVTDESMSAVRMRAADKAAFVALQNLPLLNQYRYNMEPADFQNKIYKLADKYLDNLNIMTIKQTNQNLCVKINASLSESSIKQVFGRNESIPAGQQNDEVESFDIELPPKPKITINEDIAYVEESDKSKLSDVRIKTKNTKRIFVDRTEFFDGTSTNKFFDFIKRDLLKIHGIEVVNKPDGHDYVLKTKVLKAKIDKLNAATNRLQVVVAVTLTDTKTMESLTEHQNRFILFASEDDAQKTASSLVSKLLSSGIGKISSHIEVPIDNDGNGLIAAPIR